MTQALIESRPIPKSRPAPVAFPFSALRFSPYTRLDFMSTQLDGYSEQGSSAALLAYRSMAFQSVAGTLGLRGSRSSGRVEAEESP
jgi:uncharacterized protein YhjY with autotransporter beta-barrel domain